MVNIEIDGIAIKATDGAMIIEAADEAGIPIARFCYHKKLSIAANCRMCLVDVEKAAKPLPACATPVTEGMKVQTKSERALDAQRGTMEFLLINHPLDCPICDQGGECDLQDVSIGYGGDHSRFTEGKRVVQDKNLGPLISTDMTRCIHCTRCVRFGEEIGGIKELGATGRGEHLEIGTYVEKAVNSELSGNVIDLCPVGALTSKPFRYSSRPWELTSLESVAPHDCIGSNIYLHTRRGKVMRVLPKENETINETWISDRDRFSYEGLNSDDRLDKPMIKRDGQWQEVDWETALQAAVSGLKNIFTAHSGKQVGTLISPNATVEEMYLTQKLLRALGSSNIDHRLRETDVSDQAVMPVFPSLSQPIEALERADNVLLIGSNIRKDQPIAGHRIRKAALNGARVMVVNPVDYEFRFKVADKIIATPVGMERALAGIAKALMADNGAAAPTGLAKLLATVESNETHRAIAMALRAGQRSVVLLGSQAAQHPAAATLRALAGYIAETTEANIGFLSAGANGAGGWLAGAVPHRGPAGTQAAESGLSASEMVQAQLKAYVLLGVEPELDCADSGAALSAMQAAEFVVALTPYVSATLREVAQVLLPIGTYAETAGTFINAEDRWQSFSGAVNPPGEARPGWKVLRVLGNLFGVAGFDYFSAVEVRDELARAASEVSVNNVVAWPPVERLSNEPGGVVRLADVPIYAVDGIVRRATSLQQSADGVRAAVFAGATLAEREGLNEETVVTVTQNGRRVTLPVVIDERIPKGCVWIPAGMADSVGLGSYGSPLELSKG